MDVEMARDKKIVDLGHETWWAELVAGLVYECAAIGKVEEIQGGEVFDPYGPVGESKVVVWWEREVRVPELFDAIAVVG
jgi:hypothetical protein